MEIRKLNLSEHDRTRALYEEVFSQDSTSFVNYYYTEKTKDNQIYVIEVDGGIRTMIHLNPYKMYINGQEKVLHYIVAVATQESYRKRGYMGALLKQVLRNMSEAGESFTFLMPAAEAIYSPYDFKTVYEQEQRFYDEKDMKSSGAGMIVQEAGEAELPELAEEVNQYLRNHYDIFALRSPAYYERLMKEYASDNGKLMICKKGKDTIECHSMVMEKEPEGDKPKIMVRILNLERMLMSLKLASLIAVCFKVTDAIIPENNRCILLTGTEFSGPMLMEGQPDNSEGCISIGALTELVFGSRTVEELCLAEDVTMTERMKEELHKLVPAADIYINEIV